MPRQIIHIIVAYMTSALIRLQTAKARVDACCTNIATAKPFCDKVDGSTLLVLVANLAMSAAVEAISSAYVDGKR